MDTIRDVPLTHNGTTRNLRDWADVMGIEYVVVRMRYKRGKRTFTELFGNPRGYKKPDYVPPNYRDKALVKRNIKERVEKLEHRLDALKQVVLQIAEKVNHD